MRSLYETLGVTRDASIDDVRTAYRSLMAQWHPDRNLDKVEAATQITQRINAAYAVLSNAQRRAEYDQLLDTRAAQRTQHRQRNVMAAEAQARAVAAAAEARRRESNVAAESQRRMADLAEWEAAERARRIEAGAREPDRREFENPGPRMDSMRSGADDMRQHRKRSTARRRRWRVPGKPVNSTPKRRPKPPPYRVRRRQKMMLAMVLLATLAAVGLLLF
jgi:curved DNA-binding protein CbpA